MALVANGKFDAAISLSEKSDWDIAAAELVVAEAGGRVSTADGRPLSYGSENHRHPSVIATGAYIFDDRSEEHTSELQSLMRISYAVFCLKTKNKNKRNALR